MRAVDSKCAPSGLLRGLHFSPKPARHHTRNGEAHPDTVFSLALEESTRRSLVATSSGSDCRDASRFMMID